MTDKEAMKLALDSLEQMKAKANFECWNLDVCDEAITALKEALAQEKALQALHNENERLGLYKDAYAQPEQEPVGEVKNLFTQAAWEKLDVRGSTKVYLGIPPAQPAPVQPAQRKPLTDDQIRGLTPKPDGVAEGNVMRVEVLPGVMGTEFDEVDAWSMPLVLQIARAIEAAHGIKENT